MEASTESKMASTILPAIDIVRNCEQEQMSIYEVELQDESLGGECVR
jgi:hypothetical protein